MCGGCHNLLRTRPKCQSGNPALVAARFERQQQLRKRQEEQRRQEQHEEEQQLQNVELIEPKIEIKQESRPRSKTCGICNGEAETYHLNYGASSCFSCRAFFRRVVQKDSADKLKCKFDGNCDLDPKSTTKCRKCRYDRCIGAGMQPGMVLQGSEKITRFRKLITKQMEAEGKLIKRVDTGAGPKRRGRKKKALVSDLPEEFKVGIKLSFKKKQGGGDMMHLVSPPQSMLMPETPTPQMAFTPSPTSSYSSMDEPMMQMPVPQEQNMLDDEDAPKVEDLIKSNSDTEMDNAVQSSSNAFDETLLDLGSGSSYTNYYSQQMQQMQMQGATDSLGGSMQNSPPSDSDTDASSSPLVIDNSLMDFITKQVLSDGEASPAPSFEELMEEVEVVPSPGCKNVTCVCSNMLCNKSCKIKSGLVDIEAQYSHLLEMKSDKAQGLSCLSSEVESYKDFSRGLPKAKQQTVWKMKQLQKTWMLACLGTDFDLVVVQNILLYHFGHREAMTLDSVKTHLTKLITLFHNFAKQQKEFVALSAVQQAKLLSVNAPLFIQYMLGRYFTSASGPEQLRWMLVNGVPSGTRSEDVANALNVDFDAFNESVCLFSDPTATQLYKENLKDMAAVALPQVCSGHVAITILFRGHEQLIDLDSIEPVLRRANKSGPFSLALLHNNLQGMAELFERHTVETFNWTVAAHQICLTNSSDEESWLSGTLSTYRDIVGSVNLGKDMTNEFLMFNLDVPFSQHYPEVLGQVVRERMTRVLAYSQDFQGLNYEEQSAMLKYNLSLCMTLHLARCCASNANQQVHCLMGREDKTQFDQSKPVLHDRPLKRITLGDISKNMSAQDMSSFTQLSQSLASFVREDDLFDVLVHCLLFSSEHVPDSSKVKSLESRFFLALERRLLMKSGLATRPSAHVEVLKKFMAVIESVKDLSGLVTKYFLHIKEEETGN